jgi:hypothetical protein
VKAAWRGVTVGVCQRAKPNKEISILTSEIIKLNLNLASERRRLIFLQKVVEDGQISE